MYLYIFSIIFLIAVLSNIYKREHYVLKNNEYLNTDIFDDIIKKSNKEDEQKKITKKKKPVIWKQLRDNIDDHTTQMFKWRSDQKYRQRNSINNMINKVKQKYNDNLCQRYVKFYNFNYSIPGLLLTSWLGPGILLLNLLKLSKHI